MSLEICTCKPNLGIIISNDNPYKQDDNYYKTNIFKSHELT